MFSSFLCFSVILLPSIGQFLYGLAGTATRPFLSLPPSLHHVLVRVTVSSGTRVWKPQLPLPGKETPIGSAQCAQDAALVSSAWAAENSSAVSPLSTTLKMRGAVPPDLGTMMEQHDVITGRMPCECL